MATTMKLISKNILTSPSSSVEFIEIPQTFTDLLILGSARSSTVATNDNIKIRFNGQTTDSNFSCKYIEGNGSTVATGTISSFGFVSNCNSANNTINTFTSIEMFIPNYSGSTNKIYCVTQGCEQNGTTSYVLAMAGVWSNTSIINSFKLLLTSGANFEANSSFYIYGITKA